MGYSIIFETKIVKLTNGNVIHFDRSGCNNDTEGRKKNEFVAKIYTMEDFIKKAEKFKAGSKPYKESEGWEIKIGSRYANGYDYGEHLLRMLKRAENYKDFVSNRYFQIKYCTGIEILNPENRILSFEEFGKYRLEHMDTKFTYRYIMNYPDVKKEQEVEREILNNKYVEAYIGRKWKCYNN